MSNSLQQFVSPRDGQGCEIFGARRDVLLAQLDEEWDGVHQHTKRFKMERFASRMARYSCEHAYRMPWLRLDSFAARSDGSVLKQL